MVSPPTPVTRPCLHIPWLWAPTSPLNCVWVHGTRPPGHLGTLTQAPVSVCVLQGYPSTILAPPCPGTHLLTVPEEREGEQKDKLGRWHMCRARWGRGRDAVGKGAGTPHGEVWAVAAGPRAG